MPSQHSRPSKRRRGHAQDDEAAVLLPRSEEPLQPESYSRSHHHHSSHHSDNYSTSSASSSRAYYDMNRESSSSRKVDADPWLPGPEERYSYASSSDGYRRGAIDDYELIGSRDTGNWASRTGTDTARYSSISREWEQRYEDYVDPSWKTHSSGYDERNSSYESWPQEDSRRGRSSHPQDRAQRIQATERVVDETGRWQRERRREKSGKTWEPDSGWGSRARESGGSNWEDHPKQSYPALEGPSEDRKWEPAPSWKSSHDEESSRAQNGSTRNGTSHSSHKNAKSSSKKSHNHTKSKRSAEKHTVDDSDFNNWTKRTKHHSTDTKSTRHNRSYSSDSLRSHYSSRARSRSRSTSPPPKRLRQDSSPVKRSRTPGERWVEKDQYESPNSPYRSPRKQKRQRSLSTVSSRSSERSASRSPVDHPRAVHRLPTVSTRASLSQSDTSKKGHNKRDSRRNGARAHNGSKRLGYESADDMPPPSSLPTFLPSTLPQRPIITDRPAPPPLFAEPPIIEPPSATPSATPRLIPPKGAGFKPIGQKSSSLKRFFPRDDEDMDVSPNVLAVPRSQESSHEKQSSALRVINEDTSIRTPQGDGPSPTEEPDRHRSRSQHSRPSDPPSPPLPQPLRQSVDPRIRREDPRTAEAELPSKAPTPPVDEEQLFGVDSDKPLASSSRDGSYNIVSQVGEGTFGKVYKAQNVQTGVHVALKRIRMESEKDGFPVTAMREIKLLQSLRHANVVRLYEILVSSGAVYMVFEYMDHDLTGILSQSQFSFSDAHLKSLCHQMLAGLSYLHHKGVIHRDIKGSNILINNRGELKLADFGLARFYQKRRRTDYTNRVITLWYRPPELLFGATVYGPEVDMWSAGCIMLELFTKKPVFQGNDEIHQLDVIYRILGTPTQDRWPDIINLPWYELVKPRDPVANRFREMFQRWMSPAALDLAEQLLAYDPSKRASAVQAMEAPYFNSEQPEAERPYGLANLEGEWHELETKRERAKKRKKE